MGGLMSDKVTIKGEVFYLVPEARMLKIDEEIDWLMCLEAAGVDNWEGYDSARKMQRGEDVY
jgi:hypothetical protein